MGCGVLRAFIVTGGQKNDGLSKTLIVRNQFYILIYVKKKKVLFTGTFGSPLTLVSVGGKDGGREEEWMKGGGALAPLEEEKRLGPPAVNKVDSPTDGLNDRAAE